MPATTRLQHRPGLVLSPQRAVDVSLSLPMPSFKLPFSTETKIFLSAMAIRSGTFCLLIPGLQGSSGLCTFLVILPGSAETQANGWS